MPTFQSKPLGQDSLSRTIRRYPALFGVPFVLIIVGASFGMSTFTQTRYDLHAQRQSTVSKEEELKLQKRKKKFDIREEYYRLQSSPSEDWEPKRIERPPGVPEWGVPPTEAPEKK